MMWLFQLAFGCRHRRISWPLTVRKPQKETYVVCLECGRKFDYDWNEMRVRAA
jgi:hypothetical protein